MQLVRQTLSFQLFQNYNFRILDIQTWTEIESIIERHIFFKFSGKPDAIEGRTRTRLPRFS